MGLKIPKIREVLNVTFKSMQKENYTIKFEC